MQLERSVWYAKLCSGEGVFLCVIVGLVLQGKIERSSMYSTFLFLFRIKCRYTRKMDGAFEGFSELEGEET